MTDAMNRKRWATDQKKRARAAFAAQLPSVEQERADRPAALRDMAEAMEGLPHMATSLARVRTQIAELEP